MTKSEGQKSIVLQVLEGESALPGDCTAIGRTVIRDLPGGLPKNWPVEVTFEYGANGRLMVRAVVPGTHRETTLELERDVGLSREGISRWKQVVAGMAGFAQFEGLLDEVLNLPAVASGPVSGQSGPALPGAIPPVPAPFSPAALPAGQAVDAGRWDSGPLAGIPAPPVPAADGTLSAPTMGRTEFAAGTGPISFQPIPQASFARFGSREPTMPHVPHPTLPQAGLDAPAPGPLLSQTAVPNFGGEPRTAEVMPPIARDQIPGAAAPSGAATPLATRIDLSYFGIEEAKPQRKVARWVFRLIGYGISMVLGLVAGWLLIGWLFPGAHLPSLW